MKKFVLSYKLFGNHALLIEWPSEINETVLKDVLIFKNKITDHFTGNSIIITNAYNSLLINDLSQKLKLEEEINNLKNLYNRNSNILELRSSLWRIPVCYDKEFGFDLEEISSAQNITVEEIIELHTQSVYTVYFIGFLPGFLYLGGLDERLFLPRKQVPRLKLPKGSVAIGADQTGVYPSESPGGWNVIGNSPIDFFNIEKEQPCFAKAGDKIQFYPISLEKHHEIQLLVREAVHQMDSIEANG